MFLTLITLFVCIAFAEPEAEKPTENSISEHKTINSADIVIDSKKVKYTVETDRVTLKLGEQIGELFYTSYTRAAPVFGVEKDRPIAFVFNGGPGSSSVWLHLGMLGPRRIQLADDQHVPGPTYQLVDNEQSILDKCDLVFVDPIGTGFSQASKEDERAFYGVKEDVKAVGLFIEQYLSEHQRWNSPRILIGESYGTTRAAKLSEHLHNRGIYLNGIVLVSAVLQFQSIRFGSGNDLPYSLFLPSYAATAWHHKVIDCGDCSLESFIEDARSFARSEYALALIAGSRISQVERQHVLERLSYFTGLQKAELERVNLRPSRSFFGANLLENQEIVGRFDGRVKGRNLYAKSTYTEDDPSYSTVYGAYTSAINHYLRSELEVTTTNPYEILSGNVNGKWNWGKQTGYLDVSNSIANSIQQNPDLEVLIANGYFDLATPFFATEHTVAHLPQSIQENITMTYYPGGHMMYHHLPSLSAMRKDILELLLKSGNTDAP